jgi:hypothetical protein
MEELTEIRLQIAQGITNLDAKIRRQEVSIYVLRKTVAALLNPQDPESAAQGLEKIETGFQRAEAQLQDNRELLEQIRKLQKRA